MSFIAVALSWTITVHLLVQSPCWDEGFGQLRTRRNSALLHRLGKEFSRLPTEIVGQLSLYLNNSQQNHSTVSHESRDFPIIQRLLRSGLHQTTLSDHPRFLLRSTKVSSYGGMEKQTEAVAGPNARAKMNADTIWDIPRTDIYADWQKPPGDVGSELRRNNKLGFTETARREARGVVEMATLEYHRTQAAMYNRKVEKPFVARFDRHVHREKGVFYNVLMVGTQDRIETEVNEKHKAPRLITSVHIVRPFAPLRVESTRSDETSSLLNIVVAVHNRTPQLISLMRSIKLNVNGGQNICLVVVDSGSTDANVRQVVLEKSGLPHTRYLWTPRRALKFSRALLLDFGIRAIHAGDPNAFFFTMDVDLLLPPSKLFSSALRTDFRDIVWSSIERGRSIYAPIVDMKTKEGDSNYFDWGYGMLGAYTSDFVSVGGYDVKRFQYGWGGEDIALATEFLRRGYTIIRPEEPGLIHLYHEKLGWRGKNHASKCKFSWIWGEVCRGAEFGVQHSNDHKGRDPLLLIESQHSRSWILKVSNLKNCGGPAKGVSIDIPPGSNFALFFLSGSSNDIKFSLVPTTLPHRSKYKIQGLLPGTDTDSTGTKVSTFRIHAHSAGRLVLWHANLKCSKDQIGASEPEGRETISKIAIQEIFTSALVWKSRVDKDPERVGARPTLVAQLGVDGLLHCGNSADVVGATVVLAPGYSYHFVADHGGFDAGDGMIYFKVELHLVTLVRSADDDTTTIKKKEKKIVLQLDALGDATDAVWIEDETLVRALARDRECSDNRGTMFVQLVREFSS